MKEEWGVREAWGDLDCRSKTLVTSRDKEYMQCTHVQADDSGQSERRIYRSVWHSLLTGYPPKVKREAKKLACWVAELNTEPNPFGGQM